MEKKFFIQSRFYAQPLDNDNYTFFCLKKQRLFLLLLLCILIFQCATSSPICSPVCVGKDWEYVWRLKLALRCLSPSLHTLVFGDKVSH